jgi:hypothetical protein
MNNSNKFLSHSLCLLILISFNSNAAIGDDHGEESTIEKNLTVDVSIGNILEPLALLNAATLSDELQNSVLEISNEKDSNQDSLMVNDLKTPAYKNISNQ